MICRPLTPYPPISRLSDTRSTPYPSLLPPLPHTCADKFKSLHEFPPNDNHRSDCPSPIPSNITSLNEFLIKSTEANKVWQIKYTEVNGQTNGQIKTKSLIAGWGNFWDNLKTLLVIVLNFSHKNKILFLKLNL